MDLIYKRPFSSKNCFESRITFYIDLYNTDKKKINKFDGDYSSFESELLQSRLNEIIDTILMWNPLG